VSFSNVLLIDNEGKVEVGAPVIDGAAVNATVVKHLKADKVLVFKKKRRKGYQKLNGHRQQLTQIAINEISAKGATKKAAPKKEKVEAKTEEKQAVTETKE